MSKLFLTLALLTSLVQNAFAENTQLGVCEGDSTNHSAYLIKLYRESSKNIAQVYRYVFSGFGDETLQAVGGPIQFWDDTFIEEGEKIVHHLLDKGLDYDSPDELVLHISYTAGGKRNGIRSYIKITTESRDKIELKNGACSFFQNSKFIK